MSLRDAYVQHWTSFGWYDDDDDESRVITEKWNALKANINFLALLSFIICALSDCVNLWESFQKWISIRSTQTSNIFPISLTSAFNYFIQIRYKGTSFKHFNLRDFALNVGNSCKICFSIATSDCSPLRSQINSLSYDACCADFDVTEQGTAYQCRQPEVTN